MNDKRYKWTLYLIVFVILCTIGIQVYWNYKNYQVNKQQLINDVQVSLDNAVDLYYEGLAHESTIALTIDAKEYFDAPFTKPHRLDSILINHPDYLKHELSINDSVKANINEGIFMFDTKRIDSMLRRLEIETDSLRPSRFRQIQMFQTDSIALDEFKNLTSKVLISITQDSLNLNVIDSILKKELDRKSIAINYGLELRTFRPFKNTYASTEHSNKSIGDSLSTTSKSSFLPRDSALQINFSNTTKTVLKRILSGILISTLLVLAVISCLFYLLKIIRHQKQLAEVKNDLISNITHEFKTPIATIGVALESIKSFNVIDDKEKTKDYLNMSSNQLGKLNMMVEKLLETATLDSENLNLNKESIDLVTLLETVTNKHKVQLQNKTLSFTSKLESHMVHADVFHFENAINNIIDNAIKYGGDTITINLVKTHLSAEIIIADNGGHLNVLNKEKIFEKFYRVPKGNKHDIKGFGIGLYYTKKIVEKHNGIVTANVDNGLTSFKIILPNE